MQEPDQWFSTQDLLSLGIIPEDDAALLLKCTEKLLSERLFKVSSSGGDAFFKAVKREEAAR